MKILSRDFTTSEKVLLLFLCLILIALCYYRFVFIPVQDDIRKAHAERDALQVELTAVEAKVDQLNRMKNELDTLGTLEDVSRMDSYNNSQAELALLNGTLATATTYSVSFANVTREGDQIRRNFTLQFTADDYQTVRQILTQLSRSPYRCLLGDVTYVDNQQLRASSQYGTQAARVIAVNATATFYETMYGGTPDAGLPEDSAEGLS